jgi:hypothetical protein
VRLDFNQPHFFALHYSFGVDAQDWRTFTPVQLDGRRRQGDRDAPENLHTSRSVSLGSEREAVPLIPTCSKIRNCARR